MFKKIKLFLLTVILVLVFICVALTWVGLREYKNNLSQSLIQISGRVASVVADGDLNKEEAESLKVALVIEVTSIIEAPPTHTVHSEMSDQAIVDLCNLIRNSKKIFPENTLNSVDAQVFSTLRSELQALRPLVEQEIGSRQGLGREAMLGCHWSVSPAKPH